MADRKPLLSLTTLTECPTIEIDGQPYALRPLEALDIVRAYRLEALRGEYAALAKKLSAEQTLSASEAADAERAVDELVRLFLDAPADVIDKLTTVQKTMVAQAFYALLPPKAGQTMGAATRPTSRPTGARSSRGFSGSTAARRSRGSRKRRSRSSART